MDCLQAIGGVASLLRLDKVSAHTMLLYHLADILQGLLHNPHFRLWIQSLLISDMILGGLNITE